MDWRRGHNFGDFDSLEVLREARDHDYFRTKRRPVQDTRFFCQATGLLSPRTSLLLILPESISIGGFFELFYRHHQFSRVKIHVTRSPIVFQTPFPSLTSPNSQRVLSNTILDTKCNRLTSTQPSGSSRTLACTLMVLDAADPDICSGSWTVASTIRSHEHYISSFGSASL